MDRERRTLQEAFDGHPNGLASIRLFLASMVIFWHSFPLTGTRIEWGPLRELVGGFRVDAFFAISGFLILRSWIRRPSVVIYLRARLFRIFPAFWFNLVFVALVIAPGVVWLSGGPVGALFGADSSALRYIFINASTYMAQYGIGGTPIGVPFPNVWNGSVWTLFWEMLAYAGLLLVGLTRLYRRRALVLSATGFAWISVLLDCWNLLPGGWYIQTGARFALLLLCGASLYLYRDRVVVSARGAIVAGIAICVGPFLGDYRLTGAPALAYLAFWFAVKMRSRVFRPLHDLSYGLFLYGFPVQQSLLLLGVSPTNPWIFFLVSLAATVPFAAMSWFFIERPARNFRRRIETRPSALPSANLQGSA